MADDTSSGMAASQSSPDSESSVQYANRHVGKFLALDASSSSDSIQVLSNGSLLTAKNLLSGKLSLSNPILVRDSPSSIGMTVLKSKTGQVNVRDVADVIGHAYPVSVIDVRHQEELQGWTMGDLVEYFEDEERLSKRGASPKSPTYSNRRRRAAAAQALEKQQQQLAPKVLNQISLEFSSTPLVHMVKSPKFVRDLDWIDHAWPFQRKQKMDYPQVQYYCLTSTAGCYTDFHADFGGSSVWYHVLSGEKQFCLIRPTAENLAVYEDWLCRPNQANLFLPEMVHNKSDVITVSLEATQTLVIPTGWIHAVYTPVDSLVIGGNFLHGLDIALQLEIHYLETRTRVPGRFRFPQLVPLQFYAGGMYLRRLLSREFVSARELEGLESLIVALEEWWKLQADETLVVAAKYAAETSGCASVEEFLTLLKLERTRRLMKSDASSSLPPEKPKLRLKLAGSDTSKPRVKLSPPRNDGKKPESPVRIKLSSLPPDETKPAVAVSSSIETGPQKSRLSAEAASKPTGIRIRLSPEKTAFDSDFRIVLPSSARPVVVAKKRRTSIQREGLEEYIPASSDADEWKPSKSKKRGSSSSRPQATKKGMTAPQRKKPTSTSRQRLMKRFR